mmetsp:Transcript_8055/g.29896  ORF Transcript_8055/g.29896 Transcript_8055/m.29896 type:complete len:311 (+) Transcript_8055:573-1505(+)
MHSSRSTTHCCHIPLRVEVVMTTTRGTPPISRPPRITTRLTLLTRRSHHHLRMQLLSPGCRNNAPPRNPMSMPPLWSPAPRHTLPQASPQTLAPLPHLHTPIHIPVHCPSHQLGQTPFCCRRMRLPRLKCHTLFIKSSRSSLNPSSTLRQVRLQRTCLTTCTRHNARVRTTPTLHACYSNFLSTLPQTQKHPPIRTHPPPMTGMSHLLCRVPRLRCTRFLHKTPLVQIPSWLLRMRQAPQTLPQHTSHSSCTTGSLPILLLLLRPRSSHLLVPKGQIRCPLLLLLLYTRHNKFTVLPSCSRIPIFSRNLF